MKLRERDQPLDPRAERELAALDDALAGRPVDPDLAGLGELASLLADERPEPDPAWSAELDERAARRFRPEGGGGSPRDLLESLRGLAPRRLAGPVGALATAAVVAVVAVSTLSGGEASEPTPTSLKSIPTGSSTASQAAPEAASGDSATVMEDQSASGPPPSAVYKADAGAFDRRDSLDPLRAGGDKLSPGTENRQVDRDVAMRLSARPDEVRDVSDDVITITRSLDGIVVNSQVSEAGRSSAATLELTIPSKNLDTAIDRLSDLAHVDSLNETTADITHPYVTAQDDLRDAQAERRSLLDALADASTAAEAESLRLQIADTRRRISQAQARFENIAREARLSTVSVEVVADPDAPATDDGRSIGDWLDDALSVLRDVAGVLLITAAIVVPLAILAGIAWLLVSRLRKRRRERALDA